MVADKKGHAPEPAGSGSAGKARDGGSAQSRRAEKPADTHVASALKTAYHATVQEDVPPEFLDLLGKLA